MAYSTKNCMVGENEAREIRKREAQRQRRSEFIKRAWELFKKKQKKEETEEKKIDNLQQFVLGMYMKKDSP